MPPLLAAILCWTCVVCLIRWDARFRPPFERALWVPLLWLLLLGSRPLSYWLGVDSSGGAGEISGNAFDRNVYLLFWAVALVILNRAGIRWGTVLADNWPIVFFYGFLLASCLWADAPFVTFKRWFKDLSAVFLALVILSRRDAREAVEAVFFRVALVLLPVSILLIKYFSHHGRRYSPAGGLEVTGVCDQKNSLGTLILMVGIVVAWCIADRMRNRELPMAGRRLQVGLLILALGSYLLWQSDSKTAMLSLAIGVVIVMADRLPVLGKSPKAFLAVATISPLVYFVGDRLFGLRAEILAMLGRDATLTNRTRIWDAALSKVTDPLFGDGYLMFWDLHSPIWLNNYPVYLKTVHNGYLEMYLDGGWIGVVFLAVMLIGVGVSVSREFLTGSHFGRLQLAVFVVLLIHNYSESTFARLGPVWFGFLLFCGNYARAFAGSLVAGNLSGDEYTDDDEPLPARTAG